LKQILAPHQNKNQNQLLFAQTLANLKLLSVSPENLTINSITEPYSGSSLFRIPVDLNGHFYHALVDSRSSVCVFDIELLRFVGCPPDVVRSWPYGDVELASGQFIRPLGLATIPIEIHRRTILIEGVVTKDRSCDLILGMNVIQFLNLAQSVVRFS
jgi:hypothetical protein